MRNPPSDVLGFVPDDLPIPLYDGACDHLENMSVPKVSLFSTDDQEINLSYLSGWNVIFCYPMTGRPGSPVPTGWINIPGAAGCTPQVCAYRENQPWFKQRGVGIYGVSTQTTDEQKEAVGRLGLPYPLLSDAEYDLVSAIELPVLEVEGRKMIRRLTLILKENEIKKCFYPVFPPDKNVIEVINWLNEKLG
jgi:peroxiredoxin